MAKRSADDETEFAVDALTISCWVGQCRVRSCGVGEHPLRPALDLTAHCS